MDNTSFNLETSYKIERFFELSGDLLCITGFDGYFRRVNPAVVKLLGYSKEELLSTPINEFVHPEDRVITEMVRAELRNNKPLLNFENRYITKAGHTVWLSWTSMPDYSDSLIFAIAKDITHKVKLEQERNLLLANLTRINKEIRQFAYTTSHDLRSPLGSLLTAISLIDTNQIKDETTLELIEILKEGSEQLKETLNNHINVLSQESSLHVPVEELDLSQALRNVLRGINALVQNANVIFHINFSEVEKVRFNKAYLESIFLNLITNSIKYARPERNAEITICSQRSAGVSQLIISDNGQGFDMESAKDKIFGLHQKFHTHSDSKGIGLYLIYNHVTSLGGKIAVESQINEGTKFTISFKD